MAEATKRTRGEGRRNRAPRVSSGPLGLVAERVRGLAEELRNQQTTADYLAALQQRSEQLDGIATAAESLVETAAVLKAAGVRPGPITAFSAARQAVSELRQRYESEPQAVRQAQARSLDSPLSTALSAFRQAWAAFVGPAPGALALADLLARFPQFRDAESEIHALCAQLTEAARNLPSSESDLSRVKDIQRKLQERIAALKDDGMDADVQQFMRDSANGVPLEQLLGKPNLLEFLRTHRLLSSLTVTFRPSTPGMKR
jgi:hypothetical protein